MIRRVMLSLVILIASFSTFAQPDISMEMLKQEIVTGKRELVKANMTLPESKVETFWAIYDEYETSQKVIMDEKASIISAYTQAYYSLTDEVANELALRSFKADAQLAKLEKTIYKKLDKEISATVAVQFIQLMNRIGLMINLQIVNQLPIILVNSLEEKQSAPSSDKSEAIKASHEAEINAEESAAEQAEGHM